MQQVNANTDEVNGDGLDKLGRLEWNAHKVLIDAHKLSRGLKKTFEGISIIFDSLGINDEGLLMSTSLAPSASSAGTANAATSDDDAQTTAEINAEKKRNEAGQSENSGTSESVEKVEQPVQVVQPEEANSSITYDDITKIIVEKIKQDTANNKKIEAIVNNYGVSMVSQLPKSKYEAFMAELASL